MQDQEILHDHKKDKGRSPNPDLFVAICQMKPNSSLTNRFYRWSITGTLVLVLLLFYDRMMWSFQAPKNLFLQIAVFGVLFLHFLKPRTNFRFGLLDSVVLFRLVFIVLLTVFWGNTDDLFTRLDVLAYLTLFYFLVQLSFPTDGHGLTDPAGKYFSWLSLTGTLIAVYGIMQYFGMDIFYPRGYSYYESRVVGTFGNANTMGGFLAAVFPFAVYVTFLAANKKQKIFRVVCSLLMITAIILTLSRGAWMALSVVLLIAGYFAARKRMGTLFAKRSYRVGTVVLVAGILLLLAWQVYQLNPSSARGRFFVWKISLKMIADHPLTGIGYGRYGTRYLDYQADYSDDPRNAPDFDRAANIKQAHNEYLQVLAETGVIGFILFLSVFIIACRNIADLVKAAGKDKKERALALALASSLTITALHSLVDSPLHTLPVNILFYFVLGLISFGTKSIGRKYERLPERTGIEFSFNNHWSLALIAFGIFAWGSFDAVRKANGYIAWRKGQDYVARGEWYRGIEEYEKATRILTGAGELRFHLGAAYAYTRQPEKALACFKTAQATFNDKNLHITKGSALYQTGRYEEAEASFRTALRMYPKLLLPRLWLAEMYLNRGKVPDAVTELKTITTIQPKVITDEIRSIKKDAEKLLEIYAAEKTQ